MSEKVKPKCPECNIEGTEHIVSEDSIEQHGSEDPWFNIAYCNNCGHVYGIFNKFILKPMGKIPGFD